MFLAEAEMNTEYLRQGDILKNVPFPLLADDSLQFLGKADMTAEPGGVTFRVLEQVIGSSTAWSLQLLTRLSFAAVISQCCDIEPKHGKVQQPAIAFARLIAVPPGPSKDPEKLASLRSNKYPLNPVDPGYLNYFYVPAHDRLQGQEWVIDYNQVLSLPAKEFPGIMTRKVLQMTDDSRIRFKIKLAASYGRITQEEEHSGHPWLADQPQQGPEPI